MPLFFRGAGIGTYWHQHDARRSGFAIVNYKRSSKFQKKGLRMDLDKRIFLDHFDDAAFQQTLDTTAHTVAAAIGQARRAPAKTAACSTGD